MVMMMRRPLLLRSKSAKPFNRSFEKDAADVAVICKLMGKVVSSR
jgi:hypothetical protein